MKVTQAEIKEIIDNYNKESNRNFVIPSEIILNIQKDIKENMESGEDLNYFIIDDYEAMLCECEHDDYCVEDDEYCSGVDIHGDPQYRETRYKVCNVCGATCPILGVERTGECDYDEICGDWER